MSTLNIIDSDIYKSEILFVSNYSDTLTRTEHNIASRLNDKIAYKILTYRKSSLPNTVSYEEFLEDNIYDIKKLDILEFSKKYKNINLYLPMITERLMVDYNNMFSVLGKRYYSLDDINFFIVSYLMFLEEYIKNTNLIFNGYSDNFISTLTHYLSQDYDVRAISFTDYGVLNTSTFYLTDSLYGQPYKDFIPSKGKIIKSELDAGDAKESLKEYAEKIENVGNPIFGVFSYNIFNFKYIIFAFNGYKTKNKEIYKFLNIDRPSIINKLFANIVRVFYRISSLIYFKLVNDKFDKKYKYIYYPLQMQPEASTSARTPFLMNQLSVIENISKSLPLGYKLLVKEHPLAIGLRFFWYYKQIDLLPNVQIVSNNYSGRDLIKFSELVIGGGGTSTFEAIYLGKKHILLGNFCYMQSSMLRYVDNIKNLHNEIVSFLDFEIKNKEDEKKRMIEYFSQRALPLYEDFHENVANGLTAIYNLELNKKGLH